MIDPVNPGPAGSSGPAGSEAGIGPPGDLTPVLATGTAIIAQAIQAATSAIQDQINSIFGVVNSAIGKAAGEVTQAINTAQSTLDLSAARATGSIAATLSAATPPGSPGGPSLPGNKPIAGNWNVFQYVRTPYPSRYTQEVVIAGADMMQWCFRGSWPNVDDAGRYSLSIDGKQPPDWCIPPGGPAVGDVKGGGGGDCPSGKYQVWLQQVAGTTIGCQVLCETSLGPSGGIRAGQPMSLEDANLVASKCSPPPPPVLGGGGPGVMVSCGSGLSPIYWTEGSPQPQGAVNAFGPFADLATAEKFVADGCGAGKGTGGNGTGGIGCCDETGAVKLPKCIYIDLCDWDKFYQNMKRAIYKGLCEFVQDPDCLCKIRDSDAAIYEDCDGQLGAMVNAWKGKIGTVLTNSTVDDLSQNASQQVATIGAGEADTGSDPFGPR